MGYIVTILRKPTMITMVMAINYYNLLLTREANPVFKHHLSSFLLRNIQYGNNVYNKVVL